ncbi:thiamine pyrophosphate-binding protein [Sphingobium sp. EM0848]|uniref:thiamine pyrophosphate-binding protein n=1 Tax=Sphingobium sp. EM0848 TaxID=2743473 RepID=UPI00159CB18F|nr:thiamine pyrophosphate-binding protein [Sphingobium sp. EM0848]
MNDCSPISAIQTGGDAVCAALEALGVRTVFGIPSQQNLALYDALARRGRIRLIGARNEAGAAHAADGYARATGELGVVIASTGPGTANAMNGLYEAGFASSPVLLITTQVDRVHVGRNRGFIHDADSQLPMLRSVTRRSECVMHGHRIADTILSVATDILTGRPQPGAVEIPTDLLSAPVANMCPAFAAQPRIAPDEALLDRAAALLNAAKRPLIWIGGGCVSADAAAEVRALAARIGAPVVSSLNGRGVVPTDDPLFVGSQTHYPAFRGLLEQADAVLAIGTRFQAVSTWFWSLPMPPRLVHIDVDATILGRNYPAEVGIVGDAKRSVASLLGRIDGGAHDPEYLALAARVRADLAAETERRIGIDHSRICDAIDRLAPEERNVVCDATMTGTTWGSMRLPARRPRHFTYSTSLAIGPALPLGLGAAIGSGRRTIVLHGDGGVMLNIAELATAVEAHAPLTVLVFNNRGYGGLKYLQTMAGTPHVSVDLHTPDFAALGAAMGIASRRVDSVEAFEDAFAQAMRSDGPNLIEIDITAMVPLQL